METEKLSCKKWEPKNCRVKSGNRKIVRVDFVSAIRLESNLSDTYLQGQSLIAGRFFKLYFFKESMVYLCICFFIDSMGNPKI